MTAKKGQNKIIYQIFSKNPAEWTWNNLKIKRNEKIF
jgi:hypothetical protein